MPFTVANFKLIAMSTAPNYFAIIPASVRYDKTLPPNAKLMYGEITALANEKGYCWAGNEYFANLYDVAPETISRWVSKLQKSGHIVIEIDQASISKRKIFIGIVLDKKVNTSKQNNQEALDKKVKHNSIVNNTFNNEPLDKFFEEVGVPLEPSDNPPPKKPAGKKKEPDTPKFPFADDVRMTIEEMEKLQNQFGIKVVDWMIEKLNNYKLASGKKYKSDYRAILNWVVDEARKHFRMPIEKQKESRKLIGHHHTIDYGTNKPIQIPVYEGDTLPRFGFVPLSLNNKI